MRPPQTVLQAIGQTAVGVLGVTCVAAFSLMPGQSFAEVLLFDESGESSKPRWWIVRVRRRPAKAAMGRCCMREMNWIGCCRRFRRGWRGISDFGSAWTPRRHASAASYGARRRVKRSGLDAGAGIGAIAGGWALALRTAQIREESRALAEQLAEANRRLQSRRRNPSFENDDQHRRNGRRGGARDEQSAGRHQRTITNFSRHN